MREKPLLPWNSFDEGIVIQHTQNLWVVRVGVVVNRLKKTKKYDDSHVALHVMQGDSNTVLGYTLTLKKEFEHIFQQPTYVSFLSDVDSHDKMKYVYKDSKIHLLKFNSNKTPSYWFLVRHKVSS